MEGNVLEFHRYIRKVKMYTNSKGSFMKTVFPKLAISLNLEGISY